MDRGVPNVGEVAPDFTLKDQSGASITLSDFRGKKNVVVYFYPRDDTPICTKEACQFRDEYADFEGADAEILGVSGDGEARHRAFSSKHELPFSILSDPGHVVAKQYDAMSTFGLMAGRKTYVIDKEGKIAHVTDARFSASKHVEEARAALDRLG